MRKLLPAEITNTLAPFCEECDRRMSPVDEKGGKRHQKKNGQLFECEECHMPEVVFA
jgi:nitrate/TMAO reductase-like tetraheme cytochrome c subunit